MSTIESLKEEVLRLRKEVKNLSEALDAKTLKRYKIQAYFLDGGGNKWFTVDTHCTAYNESSANSQLDRLAANYSKHVKTSIFTKVERVDFEKQEKTWVDDMADKFL